MPADKQQIRFARVLRFHRHQRALLQMLAHFLQRQLAHAQPSNLRGDLRAHAGHGEALLVHLHSVAAGDRRARGISHHLPISVFSPTPNRFLLVQKQLRALPIRRPHHEPDAVQVSLPHCLCLAGAID